MSTVVDQLVDMGFERARAEYAYAKTGSGTLEAVSLEEQLFAAFETGMEKSVFVRLWIG